MKTRFLLIGILAMMATACADRDWEPTTAPENPTAMQSVRQRSLEEALAYADEWFAQMDEPTRGEGRRVGSVHYVQSTTRTRSGDADTLMYLVNYGDSQGFALLGRPATSKAIYAISEEGSLDMSDTLYNKPLAMFMASAREDANDLIPNPTLPAVTFPGEDQLPKLRLIHDVKPMLPVNVAKWSQETPYNRDCPYVDGKKGVIGCGPLAVGMLMAYYQYPRKMDNISIDWENIIKYNLTPTISLILNHLASVKYLNSEYITWNNRSTKRENIIRAFKFTGFGLGDVWNDSTLCYMVRDTAKNVDTEICRVEPLIEFMKHGSAPAEAAPVIMRGQSVNNENDAHFWLTDGVLQYEEYFPDFPGVRPNKLNPAFHMVWGWGGKANGYYTYFESRKKLGVIDKDLLEGDESIQFWHLHLFGKFAVFRN